MIYSNGERRATVFRPRNATRPKSLSRRKRIGPKSKSEIAHNGRNAPARCVRAREDQELSYYGPKGLKGDSMKMNPKLMSPLIMIVAA